MDGRMWTIILLVTGLVFFVVGALLVFGTFGAPKLDDAIGCGLMGLAAFDAAHLPA